MRIGSIDIVHCPSCKAQQRQKSWDTYMSYGKKYYTDGKISDGAPDAPRYIKCRECEVFFKTDNCVTKGEAGLGKGKDSAHLPDTSFLDVDGYRAAIANGLVNGEPGDILNLRLELWRKFNDRVRNDRIRICDAADPANR